jgi:hypothetical protein
MTSCVLALRRLESDMKNEREQARERYASVLQAALDGGVSYRQLGAALGVKGPSLYELLHPRQRQRGVP